MMDDEKAEYWLPFPHDDLALRCAVLHQQRRKLQDEKLEVEVLSARKALSEIFLKGKGIEVGAGSRPFPLPDGVECYYGDVLDSASLEKYFGTDKVVLDGVIDAQTMRGIPHDSLDFVISAHVIEHLHDPIGAIRATINVLKQGGVFLLVVPEMTKTWDRRRPPTTLDHLIKDSRDGGYSTHLEAAIEHARYVHPEITGKTIPEDEIISDAQNLIDSGMDMHMHAWRMVDFREMLDHIANDAKFAVEAALSRVNENAFVLRRL
ncbi:methyltransferase domain-containing protein [Agrobacterium radiobacter]|uniref:class I SAM-dependent methyltransferase n=1 Tax=Agrobacterium radiobacter TaxID=362 RepID=UPI0034676575